MAAQRPKQPPNEAGKGTSSAEGSDREQEIRIRAYEFYLERGGEPGRELDDWLQAERELAINEINFSR